MTIYVGRRKYCNEECSNDGLLAHAPQHALVDHPFPGGSSVLHSDRHRGGPQRRSLRRAAARGVCVHPGLPRHPAWHLVVWPATRLALVHRRRPVPPRRHGADILFLTAISLRVSWLTAPLAERARRRGFPGRRFRG